ncbi:succinate dehydrogenase, hydrophobic membrane anchor protein [Ruegeria faecimaris]|uniref:Succinate dehydrogenase subunit D n=1 Tax=Ruegeria faecimaris TaxID=686389 RepID=A0A521C6C3_9RHOB|nr:succinate dehydrogenase, hydrophobic membrane anchor protein [Ruegeria faecimaris]SMO54915.1 succinate dehydrogenase subunit D [Ruegeria faecimaris]
MRYLTDRKRAEGLGAGKSGTQTHWNTMVRAMILTVLIPLFIFTFGAGLGGTYEEVLAYFSRPFPAIVCALTLIVALLQLMYEAQEAIEDYIHGVAEKVTLVAMWAFGYTLMVAGLFALVKLAL